MAVKSSLKNMVLCLTVICLVCSALLGGVYHITKDGIAAAAEKKLNTAIGCVVPEYDTCEAPDTVSVDGKSFICYRVLKGGEFAGCAVKSSASGFGGALDIMVGFTPDGVIYNTSVLSCSETPGLGAKCTDTTSTFVHQFKGLNPENTSLKVKKDGGDIDAITASTITSRAYTEAVVTAVKVFGALTEKAEQNANGGTDNE